MNEPIIIDVLANDTFPEDVVVEISNPAVAGNAEVLDDNTILYTPGESYIGADDIKYRLSSSSGQSADARIGIDVGCDGCLGGKNVRLAWDPLPPEYAITGYRMYVGAEEAPETMHKISELTALTPGFHPSTPEVVYDAFHDLGMTVGDQRCFRVTAFNDATESDYSNAACLIIDKSNAKKDEFIVGV
jgi:hypothetical protein